MSRHTDRKGVESVGDGACVVRGDSDIIEVRLAVEGENSCDYYCRNIDEYDKRDKRAGCLFHLF